jgi:mono/diheme cytochrome c family protein
VRPHSALAAIAALSISVTYASRFAHASAPTQDPPGKAPYEDNCRKCHGVRGVPPKTMKVKYSKIATFNAEFFDKHSRDSIVTVLTKGKNEDMKSFKGKLTHEQMEAVADYIRLLPAKEK